MGIIYALVSSISYYTSVKCFIALYRNGSQAIGTMPDDDALVKLLFGQKTPQVGWSNLSAQ